MVNDDLVKRLRHLETRGSREWGVMDEAADRIEALTAERDAERARADRADAERDEWKQASTRHHPNPADHRYWEGRYRDEKARAEAADARVAVLEWANAQLQSDLDLRNAQLDAVHEMAPATPGLLHARLKELSEKKGPTDE